MRWTDIAHILASARQRCWSDTQLSTIDQIVGDFAEHLLDEHPGFDTEWFCRTARRYQGRHINPRSTPKE